MTDKKITSLADIRNRGTKKKIAPDVEAGCWLSLLEHFEEDDNARNAAIERLKELYPDIMDGRKQRALIMMLDNTDQKAMAKWCADELLLCIEEAQTGEAKLLMYDALIVATDKELLDITTLGKVSDGVYDLFLSPDQRGDVISLIDEGYLSYITFEFLVDQLITSATLIEDDEYVADALTTALDHDAIEDDLRERVKASLLSFLKGEGFDTEDPTSFSDLLTEGSEETDSIKTLSWDSIVANNTVAFPGKKNDSTD